MIERIGRWIERLSPYRDDERAERQAHQIEDNEQINRELREVRTRIERERWASRDPVTVPDIFVRIRPPWEAKKDKGAR